MFEFAGTGIVIGIGLVLFGIFVVLNSYGKHFTEHPTRSLRYDVMSRGTQRIWKLGFGLVGLGLLIVWLCQMLV